jgi:Xaa-Pro aminopeptidase
MTEVVGIASLLIQLTGGIKELRGLYKRFKEVPKELEGLVKDLEHLKSLLSRLNIVFDEDDLESRNIIDRPMESYKNATSSLENLVSKFQSSLPGLPPKMAIRFLKCKDEIEELEKANRQVED